MSTATGIPSAFPVPLEALGGEPRPALAEEIAAHFREEGWLTGVSSPLLIGPPMEQWFVLPHRGALPEGATLGALAQPVLRYYHQVKERTKDEDRLLGSAETEWNGAALELSGLGRGPADEQLQEALDAHRARLAPDDGSTLRLIAIAVPLVRGFWRRAPDGSGEVWVAMAGPEGPFSRGECISERAFVARLAHAWQQGAAPPKPRPHYLPERPRGRAGFIGESRARFGGPRPGPARPPQRAAA